MSEVLTKSERVCGKTTHGGFICTKEPERRDVCAPYVEGEVQLDPDGSVWIVPSKERNVEMLTDVLDRCRHELQAERDHNEKLKTQLTSAQGDLARVTAERDELRERDRTLSRQLERKASAIDPIGLAWQQDIVRAEKAESQLATVRADLATAEQEKAELHRACAEWLRDITEEIKEQEALRARINGELAERPICAAVQFADGRVALGHRHPDCYGCADGWTPKPIWSSSVQGFMTSRKRFVDRAEAFRLERVANPNLSIIGSILTSEDLY